MCTVSNCSDFKQIDFFALPRSTYAYIMPSTSPLCNKVKLIGKPNRLLTVLEILGM